MKRRSLLKGVALGSFFGMIGGVFAKDNKDLEEENVLVKSKVDDRAYWVSVLTKIATPILENISKQEFCKNMPMQVSPSYGNRDPNLGYLEAFARLLSGMAPWLALPDDHTEEGKLRKKFREQALLGVQHGVDPESPDYFVWRGAANQTVVDTAFLAMAFLRAPAALWEPLPELTKKQVVEEFKLQRRFKPNENNWLLFSAVTETFLHSIGEECLRERIDYAVEKFDKEWYVGDGWYSDGPKFHFDHYNGYVIHNMQVESLFHGMKGNTKYIEMYNRAYKRMQRYVQHLERMISPEGYPLVVGRSSTYRTAVFQPLAATILDNKLPQGITKGQARAALTAVFRNTFVDNTISESGWMTMGVVGDKQTSMADYYNNSGSLYIASLAFMPLGLSSDDEFWTTNPERWTTQKIWNGDPFPKDHYVNY
ncbi:MULTISPECIES: DUF2264 domain-containing protein [Sphingobacterium]|uniref:DUF2264 domain-containing protein n=1 Tax=Sphingobacterium TaxID=28453 RepID=UPI001F08F62D|nr:MULTISPECIES: DUF2264 domain-containing protein [unclassified Sphingobacterium]